MTFFHKNETGFYWGPRATSRQGRQVELAACVRGVFKLVPGQPLEIGEQPQLDHAVPEVRERQERVELDAEVQDGPQHQRGANVKQVTDFFC